MDKEKILKELRDKFDFLKRELKFEASYEEIENLCYIEDCVLTMGFVSNKFSRQLINHMIEFFSSWIGIMHSWLMPSPQDMIFMSEANKLNDSEKKEVSEMISRIMHFVRKNKRIVFEKDKIQEGKFIDELIEFDKKEFNKFMIKFHKKFEIAWKED